MNGNPRGSKLRWLSLWRNRQTCAFNIAAISQNIEKPRRKCSIQMEILRNHRFYGRAEEQIATTVLNLVCVVLLVLLVFNVFNVSFFPKRK